MSALLRTGGVVHNRLTALLSLSIVVVLFVGVSALPAQTLSIDVLDQSFGLGRFEVPLQASGGTEPYTWQLDNATCLPAGVSLRTDVPSWWGPPQPQAVLWGVTSAATTPRAYTCGLKVTDSLGATASKAVTFTVLDVMATLGNWELPDGSVGHAYSEAITAIGEGISTITLSGGELPPGLTMNSSGLIAGTPSTAGTYDFSYNVNVAGGSIQRTARITISAMHFGTPWLLPNATLGVPYTGHAITVSGAVGEPVINGCCLPPGLTLNSDGTITGTPAQTGFWGFGVNVTDPANNHTARGSFAIGVIAVPDSLLQITSPMVEDVSAGDSWAQTITVSGGTPPYSYAIASGTLPAGIVMLDPGASSLYSRNGVTLAGASAALGVHTFTLQVTDSSTPAQTVSQLFTLKVSPLTVDGASNGSYGVAYSNGIRVLGRTPPYTLEITEGRLPLGLALSSTGSITGTPVETGWFGFRVRITDSASEPNVLSRGFGMFIPNGAENQVDIGGDGNLGVTGLNPWSAWIGAGGGSGTYRWELEAGSTLPPGLTLSPSTGPSTTISGTPSQPGDYFFTIKATDVLNPGNVGIRQFHLQVATIVFTGDAQLTYSHIGVPYSTSVTATGSGAITWSLEPGSALPPGLSYTPGGVISGTPTAAGFYSFSLRATDANGYATRAYAMQVLPADVYPPLVFDFTGNWAVPLGRVDLHLWVRGGIAPYTWATAAECDLPAGIALRNDVPPWWTSGPSATLTGVATETGQHTCTLRVTDAAGTTATRTVTITVFNLRFSGNLELPDGSLDVAYNYAIEAAGDGPFSFTLNSGSLPPGLAMNSSGEISGTPTAAGTYDFGLLLSGSGGSIQAGARATISALHFETGWQLPNATQGVAYSQAISVSGASGTPKFSGCCLPAGLTLNADGNITGTTTQVGYWTLGVNVSEDGTSNSARATFALGVIGVPPAEITFNIVSDLADISFGDLSQFEIPVGGGTPPYSYEVASGSLPPGMGILSPALYRPWFNRNGAFFSGVPAGLGTYQFTLRVTDSGTPAQTASQIFRVKVSPLTIDGFPNGTYGTPYFNGIRVYGGHPGYTIEMINGRLPLGLTMSAAGVIAGTPEETGGFGFTVRITDSSTPSNVFVRGMGIYIASAYNGTQSPVEINDSPDLGEIGLGPWARDIWASGGSGSYNWSKMSGAWPPGMAITAGPGQKTTLSGTPAELGVYTFTLRAADVGDPNNYAVRQFRLRVTSVGFEGDSRLPFANVGTSYSTTVAATGQGDIVWSLEPGSALPPGLTLTPAGVIEGTSTAAGVYYFILRATDSNSSATRGYGIQVYPAGVYPPIVFDFGDQVWGLGRVEMTLAAHGGVPPYTWSTSSCDLPDGVTFLTALPAWWPSPPPKAVLWGVATAAGSHACTITVTDAVNTAASKTLNMTVLDVAVTGPHWELPEGSLNQSYSHSITAVGEGVTFALTPGNSLPPGLSMDSTGLIHGTPNAVGTYDFDYTVSVSGGSIQRRARITIWALHFDTPLELPNATQGVAYDQTIGVSGGANQSFSGCCLAPGLTLNSNGTITGTPTQAGRWNLDLYVNSDAGGARANFVLGVVGVPVTSLTIDSTRLEDISVGEQWAQTITVSGGTPPYTYSVVSGALPPGIAILDPMGYPLSWARNGVTLGGTSKAVGIHSFTLRVADSSTPAQTVRQFFSVRVSPLAADGFPNGTYLAPYSSGIRVLGGKPPYSVAITEGRLPLGLALSAAGAITGTPLETGWFWFRVGVADANDPARGLSRWFGICIANSAENPVDIGGGDLGSIGLAPWGTDIWASGGSGTYSWTLESGTSLPPGLTMTTAGGPKTTLSGTPTQLGDYTFILKAADVITPANFAIRQFRLQVTAIAFQGDWQLPFGNIGTGYSTSVAATGVGAITWSLEPGSALPPGLDFASGVITGTPTAIGVYNFTLRATDSANGLSATRGYGIYIYAAGQVPPININTSPDFGAVTVGRVEMQLQASGGNGAYTWSVAEGSTLPPGLSLRTDGPGWMPTGAWGLIGVATTPGSYRFTLTVTSGGETANREFRLVVAGFDFKDPGGLPNATVGVEYRYGMTALPETGSYTWSVMYPEQLPPGIAVSSDGVISGKPTQAGSFNFQLNLSDGTTVVGSGFSIYVQPLLITASALSAPRRLPNAQQNAPYTAITFTATGGTGPYTWNINGQPPCMNFDSASGVLSGTPCAAGTWFMGVTATDSNQHSAWETFTLNVIGDPPILPAITNGFELDDATLGSAYLYSFNVSGGTAPYTWTVSGLPEGMSLRTGGNQWSAEGTAEIWGTPTRILSLSDPACNPDPKPAGCGGIFPLTVSLTDSAEEPTTVTASYILKVSTLDNDGAPYCLRGQTCSFTLRALGGTTGYTWEIIEGRLPAGLTLNAANGQVSGTPLEDMNTGFRITIRDSASPQETLTRWIGLNIGSPDTTIRIEDNWDLGSTSAGQSYSRQLWACCIPNIAWRVQAGSELPPGLTLSADGVLSGTPSSAGVYDFTVEAADASNALNYGVRRFRLTVTPFGITMNMNLPNANVGTPYSFQLSASGGAEPYHWTVDPNSNLPKGLTMSDGGLISGTPQSAGSFTFNIRLTDSSTPTGHSGLYWSSVTIYAAGQFPPLHIPMNPDLGTVSLGRFTWQLQAQGGTGQGYVFSYAADPIPGVRVQNGPPFPDYFDSSARAALMGVIVAPGTYTTTVRVTDSAGHTADRHLTVKVTDLAIAAPGNQLQQGWVGVPYSTTLKAVGGSGTYTFAMNSGNDRPPGLTLGTDGVLSGTPTAAGQFWVNFTVTDTNGDSTGWSVGIQIDPFNITTPSLLPEAIVNTDYSVTLSASGDTGPYQWSFASGGPPCCLDLSSAGVLSGVPSATWTGSFTVRAVDQNNQESRKTLSLVVKDPGVQPLSITTDSNLGDSTIGDGGEWMLSATGGKMPYTWSIVPSTAPRGMFLDTGRNGPAWSGADLTYLTGKWLEIGSYNIQLEVEDADGNKAGKTLTLAVTPLAQPFGNLPLPGTTLVFGQQYTQQLLGLGGESHYTWSVSPGGQMILGLSLDGNGTVSGTPAETGCRWVPITLADTGGGTHHAGTTFCVNSGTSHTLNIDAGPDLGTVGPGYTAYFEFWASGSPLAEPNYTFSVPSGSSLPDGFVLLSGASLPCCGYPAGAMAFVMGVPGTPGQYTFPIRVQDAAGNIGQKLFTLRVAGDTIVTSRLPNGTAGSPYSTQLIGWGSPQTWRIYDGALPGGLTLSTSGLISGTPAETGEYTFRVTLTDGGGYSVTRRYTLHVATMAITGDDVLPVAVAGLPYSHTFTSTAAGSPVWSATNVPDGLSMSADGTLAGTPSSAGTYGIVVTVSEGASNYTRAFALYIRSAATPDVLSYDLSGTDMGYLTVGQAVTWGLVASGGTPPYTWAVANDSSLPDGLALIPASSFNANAVPGRIRITGAPLHSGYFEFDLIASDAAGASIRRTFKLHVSPVALLSVDAPNGTFGSPYTATLSAVGGTPPYTFAIESGELPDGLSLASNGTISGTPLSTGSYNLLLRATDSNQTVITGWFTMSIVSSSAVDIGFATSSPRDIMIGDVAQVDMYAWNGTPPYTVTVEPGTTLPAGLHVATENDKTLYWDFLGAVGIPQAAGDYRFRLRITDSVGNFGVAPWRLHVSPMRTTNTDVTIIPAARVGQPYNWQLRVTGGTPPYSYAPAPGFELPAGLSVSATGVITGTPLISGRFPTQIRVTHAAAGYLTARFTIVVLGASQTPPLLTGHIFGGNISLSASLGDIPLGAPFATSLDYFTVSGTPPYDWNVASGSFLPAGLAIVKGTDFKSFIVGAPTALGPHEFTLTVSDASGQTADLKFSAYVTPIRVSPARLPSGTVGVPYSASFMTVGGAAPYTIESNWVAIPPGVTLSPAGVLSGVPSVPGHFYTCLRVTDKNGLRASPCIEGFEVGSSDTPAPFLTISPGVVEVTYALGGAVPAPVPVSVGGNGASFDFTANAYGIAGLSLNAVNGTTPAAPMLVFDAAILSQFTSSDIGRHYGAFMASAPGIGNYLEEIPVVLNVIAAPPPCTYAMNGASTSFTASAGSGSVRLTTGSSCNWTASASDAWIHVTPPSGAGTTTLNFTVDANAQQAQRTGTINAGGQTYTITQFGLSCSYAISPVSLPVSAGGDVSVVGIEASSPACTWDAAGNASWITVSPASGTGSASVSVTVAANTESALGRPGTATIAGQILTVNQQGFDCTTSLSAGRFDAPATAAEGSVGVGIPSGCGYSTVVGPSWVTVTSGASGTGSGALTFTVAANSSTQSRSGFLIIGGQPFLITQDGVPCSFTISNANPIFSDTANAGSVGVSANGAACGWTASSDAGWVRLSSTSGTGSSTLSFNVDANGNPEQRSATLTVAGQTVTVSQRGIQCSYALRSTSGTVPASGGTGAVDVLAATSCAWNARSNAAWLSVAPPSSTGTASVQIAAQTNDSAASRTGTLTVAGITYTVTQAGAPCSYTLTPSSITLPAGSTTDPPSPPYTSSFAVSSSASDCAPQVTSFANWITASGSFSGSGSVTYTVLVNELGRERSGTIRVGDQAFTVTQSGANCAYSLNAYGAAYSKWGGSGSVLFSGSLGETCNPVIGKSPELTLGPLSGPANNIWTQPYTVPTFQSLNLWTRYLYINISGEKYTVKQTSW